MYTVAVKRAFIAQHYLIGGDWGAENQLHSHPYELEVQLEGSRLDQHGYLLDIVQIEAFLDELVAQYRDHTLNDTDAFKGINPSIEHFSRILAEALDAKIDAAGLRGIDALTVRLYENTNAWAAYRLER